MTRPDRDDGHVKTLVRRHWNGRAATFDDESQHGIHTEAQRERWLSVLREWTGERPRQTLDVGCGTGVVSLLLAALGHDVTGVDFAPAMLERARTKAARAGLPVGFVRGDAERLPVPDDAVDLLTARHLVWTLPDPQGALREWRRVVEPGGRLVLIEGFWDHDEPWDEYEAIHDDLPMYDGRPPAAMRETLESCGFRSVDHEALADPVLWGREPRHEYYLAVGTVPE
ncbi:class I SAM-dependent methyltransferase [Halosimplex amylolyticum]|uniref:class I SAM-dependent methyltransferase n=1 Tax=Halosimplex amylolyticum TaxID=3396616 RepID=UPI003F55E05E